MNLENIGLGMALMKIKYVVSTHRSPYSYGIKVESYICIKKSCTEEQKKCIEVWANSKGLSVMETKRIYGDKMMRFIDELEPFQSLMSVQDVKNIKKILWMRANPIPKVNYKDNEDGTRTRRSRKIGKNWKKFMYWVEAWDKFCEELK